MACRLCEERIKNGSPTIIDKAGNFIDAMGRVVVALSNGEEVVTKSESVKFRLKKCAGCEYASKNYTWCGLCGCYIKAKVLVATESCPAGKWHAVNGLTDLDKLTEEEK